MTDYNKIITTVNSITPDYQFIPDLNNTIVIDTSENRIGINTITPDENIHVSGGTIKTKDLIVLGDFSINNFTSDLLPSNDLFYNIGSIDYKWNDLFVGSGTIYMDKTPIIRMGDYTRHGANDISALIFDNSGKHLDISDIRHVNIEGDVSINNHLDIKEQLTALSDVSFMGKFVVIDDSSFNANVDVSGVLNINQSLTADGLVTTGTKIYTIYENNPSGNTSTRLIIEPSGNGEVVIMGNLDVKGTSTFISSTNVDIMDNIIRMNASHNTVTDGGIAVKNSSNVDKLFTYNNLEDYWTTNDTNINLGPNGGVVTCGFMNIDNVNINGNTIDVDNGDLLLKSDTGQVVVENITFNSNTISTNSGLDLNLTTAGGTEGTIFTQNSNLDLGTGVLSVNGVVNAHVPKGAIILWYGTSANVPSGWAICDGNNGTPNLSGKFVVCSGSSQNSYSEGQTGGKNFPTLTIQQIPPHNHQASSQNKDVNHSHQVQITSKDTQGQEHTHSVDFTSKDTQGQEHKHSVDFNTEEIGNHSHNAQSALTISDDGSNHYHEGDIHQHGIPDHNHKFEISDHNHQASQLQLQVTEVEKYFGTSGIFVDGHKQRQINIGTEDPQPQGTAHRLYIASDGGVVKFTEDISNLTTNTIFTLHGNNATRKGGGNTTHAIGENKNHNHQGSTANTSLDPSGSHSHSLEGDTGNQSVSHTHKLEGDTGNQSVSHTHKVQGNTGNSGEATTRHNHAITTQNTGGGETFDNRPEYYSLWYIMKL